MSRRAVAFAIALALALASGGCKGSKEGFGKVEGRAVSPLDGVYIQVYPAGQDVKSPPLVTIGPTAGDGKYTLSMDPGEYLLVARKRASGMGSGPVIEGDWKSEPFGPVKVASGQSITFDLVLEPKIGNLKEAPLAAGQTGTTGIAGTITDEDGKPVEGMRVQVYTYSQMSERPKYVSEKTGPDGAYRVLLPQGGTYYLSARNNFGGPPKIGDLFGRYDRGTIEPSAIYVKDGEVTASADIIVTKVW